MNIKYMPTISVIVTTHNRPNLLKRCLESILVQKGTTFEIILCADEGSIETKLIASNLLRENDTFVVVPSRKGPAATRNIGVNLANGQWISFLDDDDTFEENYFQSINKILIENTNKINYFNYSRVFQVEEKIKIEKVIINNLNLQDVQICNFIPNNALIIPGNFAKTVKIDENLQSHEDWEYLISLMAKYEFKSHNLFGPRVHIQVKESRNNDAIQSGEYLLDFIYIYRKWPSTEQYTKTKRKDFLKSRGLDIPEKML
jgi:glycosyltransferase involved in cell wall biosynthesis